MLLSALGCSSATVVGSIRAFCVSRARGLTRAGSSAVRLGKLWGAWPSHRERGHAANKLVQVPARKGLAGVDRMERNIPQCQKSGSRGMIEMQRVILDRAADLRLMAARTSHKGRCCHLLPRGGRGPRPRTYQAKHPPLGVETYEKIQFFYVHLDH